MIAGDPARSVELARNDLLLIHYCDVALNTVADSANAMIDAHSRDLTMSALSLLTEAIQKVRLARRYLHPEE